MTLRQVAEKSGLSERFLQGLEAGRANVSVLNLWEIATVLGVPAAALFEDEKTVREDAKSKVHRPVIALLGLRGAGKSSIGKALAGSLGVPFRELDRLVEQEAGMALGEIFAIHGEAYFRALELRVLEQVLEEGRALVLATSGGLVTSPAAFERLQLEARTVWLQAKPEEHMARVLQQGDTRPMRNRPQAMAELKRRLREREPLYRRASHRCSTSGRTVDEVVDALDRWARR